MTAQESAWDAAESAAAALAPDADVLASVDAAGLGTSTFAVMRRAATKPAATGAAALRYWTSVAMAGPTAAARWMGLDAPPPVPVPEGDKRFADQTWTKNPAFFAVRQAHLATSRLVNELLEAGAGNAMDDAKAALATGFLIDALAPTNFLLTNPAALKRAFETGGASLVAGANHFVDDMINNGGRPRQVDTRPFRVGDNLAATPGKVVFKNDLMELIQYQWLDRWPHRPERAVVGEMRAQRRGHIAIPAASRQRRRRIQATASSRCAKPPARPGVTSACRRTFRPRLRSTETTLFAFRSSRTVQRVNRRRGRRSTRVGSPLVISMTTRRRAWPSAPSTKGARSATLYATWLQTTTSATGDRLDTAGQSPVMVRTVTFARRAWRRNSESCSADESTPMIREHRGWSGATRHRRRPRYPARCRRPARRPGRGDLQTSGLPAPRAQRAI